MAEIKEIIDCFGYVNPNRNNVPEDATKTKIAKLGYELDKNTGCLNTIIDSEIDIDAEIQTYKDDCGLELVKKMMARGADMSVFADDGKHGADVSDVVSVNEAYKLKQLKTKELEELARKLGIKIEDLKEETVDALVKKAIEDKIKANEDKLKVNVPVEDEVITDESK